MRYCLSVLMRGVVATATALFLHAQANAATVLREATIGEPPPLDVMLTTADVASVIGRHIFETLYALDSSYTPRPLLAESDREEDGGRTIVIKLREGILFHNGKEMTAKDVVASMARWGSYGARGKLLMAAATSVEASGKYEVTLKLSAPNGAWKALIADVNGGLAIYPEEISANAGNKPIEQKDYIGTGPYRFVEWRPNRYVEVEKFNGYKPVKEKGDGFAGARAAIFDKIRFIPVPDVGTRVSGVQAGDYDYAEMISGDLYESLSKDQSVQVQRTNAPIFGLFFMNSKQGILKDNYKLRRAIQTALDKSQALRVAFGPKDLWNAEGSIFPKGTPWYSSEGVSGYSAHDPKKAKELAKEADYTGTPIRLLVSTNYQAHYDEASVFTRQLADAGINVQMMVVDWATLLKMRGQPEQWDIFVTHHSFSPDPLLLTFLNASYPGWWDSPEIGALRAELIKSTDPSARKATWDKIQALIYEQVPVMKVGDAYTYDIASPKLRGLNPNGPVFWNVSTK
ncbi:ABC transporter substrate-binding protein [Bradyrhizobium liaoningense]|uniref:ABC transporter substrate-binding protein n=1 Tax=Bradyrhizobium liaoningense TaxID=43992 RepID=UPI001BA4E22E|nr:ABC transporter substrate-binding protein [Bradyrhizobium liaoningense]MBR0839930.1 ABC transporter substrate-binding protein [Bradyrhizobium liaoningense]MBR0854071.1 ABC transporter substrate-binding protein [Bradyrhizobium liaoningense]